MDFCKVRQIPNKREGWTIRPSFQVITSEDLMIRGKSFYAIWDEDQHLWSTHDVVLAQKVDAALQAAYDELAMQTEQKINVQYMTDYDSTSWKNFHSYCGTMSDSYHQLNEKILFANEESKKEDYISVKLPYSRDYKNIPKNYNLIMETLYDPEERQKLEWAIGSIFTGASKHIQKFIVLYGDVGSGKSTFLKILTMLFEPFCASFDAKTLGMASAQFSLEAFRDNPLVAIQHDGDLSHIEDNTRLNSIVSHEKMLMNEKHKSSYTVQLKTFLFMGSNKPVKITDGKSGLIRRLIDVSPSGRKVDYDIYMRIMDAIPFELGAIANHCIEVFEDLGEDYYDRYTPIAMLYKTNRFYNFVEANYSEFSKAEYITLTRAFELYKAYCEDALEDNYRFTKSLFREELKNYFEEFRDRIKIEDQQFRSVYLKFRADKFEYADLNKKEKNTEETSIQLNCTESLLDSMLEDCPAQYANAQETPSFSWDNVRTTLRDISTDRLHYVRPPLNHIVIDFDLKDSSGEKSAKINLIEAAKWPATYAEFSKGGNGIHLHYIYDGDVSKLSSVYSPGIEVKVFNGKSSLRRKLSYCNDIPVAHLSSGLPFKEDKKVVSFDRIKNEQAIRTLILRNLRKEYHGATKPSVDFIHKILEDAYNSDVVYDVRDMRPQILAFANNSTNNSDYCLKLVTQMKFMSEKEPGPVEDVVDDSMVFYDLEVFPNLLIICWKIAGKNHKVQRMINPGSEDIERLMKMKLVGFNNRRYDNHILYARYLGWNNEELYKLSQKLISNSANATFREAYNLSYADIYEFSSKKQSLKKFEIELGIHHQENQYPWDQPLPEDKWEEVAEYCENDVIATEATFNARYSDYVAQEILAELTGMPVNSNGNSMAARLIFGKDRNPSLVYTNLATGEASDPAYQNKNVVNAFPGYEFVYDPQTKKPANMYRGTNVGMGGYVYAEPNMYTNVALVDVASMHPHSAIAMNYFGPYTKRFQDLVNTRLYIKHKEFDKVRELFEGMLAKYLVDEDKIEGLAYSLKIVINKVYGLTSARFDNEFRDNRNKNNIVALRGALFMRTLQDEIVQRGFTVAHIKTDSIKIPNATPEIVAFCMEFAKKYGYTFEHEATYDRMCLVNDSTYIAKYMSTAKCQAIYGYIPSDNKKAEKKGKLWTPTGAQFVQPYVFKTLFSKEPIEFEDLCETKQVTSALYLDHNERLPDVSLFEKELAERRKRDGEGRRNQAFAGYSNEDLEAEIAKGHNYKFVGRIGLFSPVVEGVGGGWLMTGKDGKYNSANGAKGYRWLESETVKKAGLEDKIDISYYRHLVDDAIENISKYGDFNWFVSDDDPPSEVNHPLSDNDVPWLMPCGDPNKTVCEDCPEFATCKYVKGEIA